MESYLKCDQCDFISRSDISLKKHINTKHTDAQKEIKSQDQSEFYMCGDKFKNPWDFLKHPERHKNRKERLLNVSCVTSNLSIVIP